MYTIEPYKAADAPLWDEFVNSSRNGTFILTRPYMDYHAHRFQDCSLLIRDAKGRVVALFAATCKDNTVSAHGGLTYGGLIMGRSHCSASEVLAMMEEIVRHYRNTGFKVLIYKPVPHIYHRLPAEEDIYALYRLGATMEGCNISSTLDLKSPENFDTNSKRNLKRAEKASLELRQSTNFSSFWNILTEVLGQRHNTLPVHSLDEMESLAATFPQHIQLWMVYDGDTPIAGTVLYLTDTVAHCQYIAANDAACANGALAYLFHELAKNLQSSDIKYLDFGTSNEDGGRVLNHGLLRQKHGFGARGVACPVYRVALTGP